jgi:pSer/pThr/pTyr-binding forkhead associated (FHA) protein
VTSCAFCGRANDAASRFCIDCGKPLAPSAARVGSAVSPSGQAQPQAGAQQKKPSVGGVAKAAAQPAAGGAQTSVVPPTRVSDAPASCPRCTKPVDATLPFCAHCGTRILTTSASSASCEQCGASYTPGTDVFCARCGTRVGESVTVDAEGPSGTQALTRRAAGPKLALLGESGDVVKLFTLDAGQAVIGRGEADVRFEADHYMSPLHARIELRSGQLWLRDLGSRNGSWVFIEKPTRLVDGDLILIGSQVLRFRRLGYPGPHPPEADSTRRMGSLVPAADVAVIEQIRADGSVRDSFHLSPGRSVTLGREAGDWLFSYDQTMSAHHAEVRSEDSEFYVHDAGSRNGVAMAVRGEREIKLHTRILVGDQILRVESL